MHLDRIERHALNERQVAVALIAAGAKGVDAPDPDRLRESFDSWLNSPPHVVDVERRELMQVLGVA